MKVQNNATRAVALCVRRTQLDAAREGHIYIGIPKMHEGLVPIVLQRLLRQFVFAFEIGTVFAFAFENTNVFVRCSLFQCKKPLGAIAKSPES